MKNLSLLVREVYGRPRPLTQMLEGRIYEALTTLGDRERFVVALRLGLVQGKRRTFKEVADSFGLTRERIRQIYTKALRKLRHPSRLGGWRYKSWMALRHGELEEPLVGLCLRCHAKAYHLDELVVRSKVEKIFSGLSTRTRNCLVKSGYHNWAGVASASEEDLLSLRNLGMKGVREIQAYLKEDHDVAIH